MDTPADTATTAGTARGGTDLARHVGPVPGRYWHEAEGRVVCDLCPRRCRLNPGQRGLCFVRHADPEGGGMVLETFGRSSGFCIDPIEKKPLNHFLPGTPVLSFGTAGCNLTCQFCQNWDISKAREFDRLTREASPEVIARAAATTGCRSVAFTYNDPVIFLEYAVETAKACHALGLRTVAVSAGYIEPAPAREFFRHMDAANVDLKAFEPEFYRKLCTGRLEPVLEALQIIHQETDCWLETTTLLIPGVNDSPEEVERMCTWMVAHLGPDVPMHFSAFHPDYRMRDVPSTPPATLVGAHEMARRCGVRYPYVGNVHDPARDSTWCAHCGQPLIGRDWYQLTGWNLTPDGTCAHCGTPVAGVFEARPGRWGRRRTPIDPQRVAAAAGD